MFFLNGCATIMSHGQQTLSILTRQDGAVCEITDVDAGKSSSILINKAWPVSQVCWDMFCILKTSIDIS